MTIKILYRCSAEATVFGHLPDRSVNRIMQ